MGLIVGLVVGCFVGAFVPPLLDGGPAFKATGKSPGKGAVGSPKSAGHEPEVLPGAAERHDAESADPAGAPKGETPPLDPSNPPSTDPAAKPPA